MDDAPGPLPPGQPRAALVDAVAAALAHLDREASAVVACSGGADSTALTFLAAEARPDLILTVAHVRHGLREDAKDAEVARQHASWIGAHHAEERVEVVPSGHGVEAAAREARFAALRRVAAQAGATAILVGHTADDQAETVLLRIARGTGTDGLAAMEVVNGDLVRPLLRLRREDVRRFVALEGLPYVEDPSNRDPSVRRALVRHELLPRLAEVGPDPVGALARLADLAREDAAALSFAAAPLREQVRWVGRVASAPVGALRSSPRSLAARVVREILTVLCGQAPSAATVGRVLGTGPPGTTTLPGGVDLHRSRRWLTLSPHEVSTCAPVPVPVRGTVTWEPADRSLRVLVPDPDDDREEGGGPGQLPFELIGAWVPPRVRVTAAAPPPGGATERMTLALPTGLDGLELRHLRQGDRIATPGGTKRVVDVAAEAGLPPPLRAVWPVLGIGEHVIWYPGLAVDRTVAGRGREAPARLLVVDLPADRGRVGER